MVESTKVIQLTFGGGHMGGSGSRIDVMPLERKAHDEAEAHRQNGAHTKVNVLSCAALSSARLTFPLGPHIIEMQMRMTVAIHITK